MKILFGNREREFYAQLITAAKSEARVESLEREIGRLSDRVERAQKEWSWERERADRAADALLASKGLPTIMPDLPRTPDVMDDPYASEDPKEVEKMLKAMGLERKHVEA